MHWIIELPASFDFRCGLYMYVCMCVYLSVTSWICTCVSLSAPIYPVYNWLLSWAPAAGSADPFLARDVRISRVWASWRGYRRESYDHRCSVVFMGSPTGLSHSTQQRAVIGAAYRTYLPPAPHRLIFGLTFSHQAALTDTLIANTAEPAFA